jgi:hypothetical protein
MPGSIVLDFKYLQHSSNQIDSLRLLPVTGHGGCIEDRALWTRVIA